MKLRPAEDVALAHRAAQVGEQVPRRPRRARRRSRSRRRCRPGSGPAGSCAPAGWTTAGGRPPRGRSPGSRTPAAARAPPRASPRPRPRAPSSRTGCRAAPAVNSCVSVGGLAVGGRADRGGARRVHHALDLRSQALLHHELRAAHVHVEQALRRRPAARTSRPRSGTRARLPSARAAPSAGRAPRASRARSRGSAIAASGEPSSTPSRTSSPRSTSSRATCDPMKPGGAGDEGRGQLRRGACAAGAGPRSSRWQSRQRTASGTAFEALRRDRLVTVQAGAVGTVGERMARLCDPALLLVEEDPGGLVKLLLVRARCRDRPGGCPRERNRSRACHRFRGAWPSACASAPLAERRERSSMRSRSSTRVRVLRPRA